MVFMPLAFNQPETSAFYFQLWTTTR